MNVGDQLGRRQIQLVVATVDVNALAINHRAHRAVEDADTVLLNEVTKVVHNGCGLRIAVRNKKTSRHKTTRGLFGKLCCQPEFRLGSLAVFFVEQFAGTRHALIAKEKAETEGFEPSVELYTLQRFSKPPP